MPHQPRRADHAVLPVRELVGARERFTRMGFLVAPDARHPFGTENCCVYLADGFYLELLAVAQREECESAARHGNAFVARDQAWRFRNGDEGFSAVAFATLDADADHRAFHEASISGGRMLAFSRPFRQQDGSSALSSFRLAFAADMRSPDSFLFTCQRTGLQQAGRERLEHHANGTAALSALVGVEANPSDFQYFLQDVARQRHVRAHSFGMDLELDGSTLSMLTPEGFRQFFGCETAPAGRGMCWKAIRLRCADLGALAGVLEGNGVVFRRHGGCIVVDPAPGQAFVLAFGED